MKLIIKILLLIFIFLSSGFAYSKPINFCTLDEKNQYKLKVEKANNLKSKWTEINNVIETYPSNIQIKIKSDVRYTTIKNNINKVNETILTYDDKANKCVLLSKSEKGTEKKNYY